MAQPYRPVEVDAGAIGSAVADDVDERSDLRGFTRTPVQIENARNPAHLSGLQRPFLRQFSIAVCRSPRVYTNSELLAFHKLHGAIFASNPNGSSPGSAGDTYSSGVSLARLFLR